MKTTCKILLLIALGLGCFAAHADETITGHDETFVVETARPLSASEIEQMKSRFSLQSMERLSPYKSEYFNRVYRVQAEKSQEFLLQSSPLVRKVQASQALDLQSDETPDPLLDKQWYLRNFGQSIFDELDDNRSKERKGVPGTDIGWIKARQEIEKIMKRDARVAVVDSGLDYEHDEIVQQLYKNEADCANNSRIPLGVPKDDKDNNGYKGDCLGINLVAKRPEFSNKPQDDIGHGTHVSGLIAATPDNGVGIAGVSGKIKILPIKIMGTDKLKDGKPFTDKVAEAILYATSRGVDVINLSLGWPISQNTDYVHKAILEAQSKGVIIVAAAGNNSHSGPIYPCAYKKVICVGSVTVDGKLSNFSNYGPQVDVVAPGSKILSIFPKTLISQYYSARGYEIKNGTSQAAPIVSGVVALLKAAFPQESSDQIRARLLAATRPLPGLKTGGGLIRLDDSFAGKALRTSAIEYKEVEMILVRNHAMRIRLPLEKFSKSATVPTIKIKSSGPQVQVQSLNVTQDAVEISGTVSDFSVHYEWPLTLSVGNDDYEMSLPLIRDESEMKVTRELPAGLDPMQLRTMYDWDAADKTPEYFRVSKADNGIDFELYEVDSAKLKSRFRTALVGETNFLGAATLDLNGDSVRDYIVYSFRNDNGLFRLSIHYLDRNGKGLFGGSGQMLLLTEKIPGSRNPEDDQNVFNFVSLANFKKLNFTKFTLADGRTIRLPALIEMGVRGPLDQTVKDRALSARLTERMYYLEPVASSDGTLNLRARTIDSAQFEEALRLKMDLYFYEKLRPLMVLAQTPEQREKGEVEFLLSVGQGEEARILKVSLNANGKIEDKVIKSGMGVLGYQSMPFWSLGEDSNAQAGTAIYGLVSPYRFDGAFWNPAANSFDERYQIQLPDTTEKLARVLQIYETPEAKYVVFESTSLLNSLKVENNGRTSLTHALVHRSSFFDQNFSQIASPLAIGTRGGYSPGLYIDNSQINARSILAWDIAGRQLEAPIALTLHVPQGCRALNPVILNGGYNYVLTCTGSTQLTFVPVQK